MRFENTSGVAGSIKNKSGQFRPLYRGNKMTEEISYTDTSFSKIAFFDENDNELMELDRTCRANDYAMRVPCIGEHIILASYEHDRFNDEKAIFRTFYKVIDVFTHYSENKAYKNISVQYSVILRKE